MKELGNERVNAYIGSELVGVATKIDSLIFLTIQSDQAGELRFEMDGMTLVPRGGAMRYQSNAHAGTIKAPVVLCPAENAETGVYKIIEDQHIVIIRNNEKYDVTGKKL